MLTAEAVGALLNHTHLAPYMRLEDVLYSGLVAGQAHLPHVNSPGFGNDVAVGEGASINVSFKYYSDNVIIVLTTGTPLFPLILQ